MAKVVYEALCAKGRKLDTQAVEFARRLSQVVRLLLDAEQDHPAQIPRYRAELATTKAQRDKYDVSLMRHVAHCTAGCKRARGGALAFAAVNEPGVNSRAPSHQKPPLPGAGELAERLRRGARLEDLCVEYERSTSTLRTRLFDAGFNSRTGEPSHNPRPVPVSFVRVDDQPWAEDALCAQTDPEAFFPEKGGSTRDAKTVCADCLVQAQCLDYALDHDVRFGIWGGLSERERRRLKKAAV